ncbi:hypothetical protein YC2023_060157 [Brassica napus]
MFCLPHRLLMSFLLFLGFPFASLISLYIFGLFVLLIFLFHHGGQMSLSPPEVV